MLLKKYSNQLVDVVLNQGFAINDFEFKSVRTNMGYDITQIDYKDPRLWFQIYPANIETFNEFRVGYSRFSPGFISVQSSDVLTFNEVKATFDVWLEEEIKPFIENENEPDYWKLILENPIRPNDIDFNLNEPFTEAEKVQLKIGFAEVKLIMSQNFNLTLPQIEATNQKLDYLIEATERLNKTDWKGITMAAMFTIASDLMLDEQKRATFFGLFSKLWAIIQHLPNAL